MIKYFDELKVAMLRTYAATIDIANSAGLATDSMIASGEAAKFEARAIVDGIRFKKFKEEADQKAAQTSTESAATEKSALLEVASTRAEVLAKGIENDRKSKEEAIKSEKDFQERLAELKNEVAVREEEARLLKLDAEAVQNEERFLALTA